VPNFWVGYPLKKRLKKHQIDVFLDTNAVYSLSITEAIKSEVVDLIGGTLFIRNCK